MKTLTLVLAALVTFVGMAHAQSPAAAEVEAAERRRFELMTSRDYKGLAGVLADDLVYTHSSAAVDDKAAYLESLTSGRVTYKTIAPRDLKVRVYGDTAIINGVADMTVDANGEALVNTLRFTDVWVKRSGTWQMVAWQSTRIP